MLSVQDVMVIGKTFLFHSKLPIFPAYLTAPCNPIENIIFMQTCMQPLPGRSLSDVKRNKSSNKGIVVHITSTLACVIKLFNSTL